MIEGENKYYRRSSTCASNRNARVEVKIRRGTGDHGEEDEAENVEAVSRKVQLQSITVTNP